MRMASSLSAARGAREMAESGAGWRKGEGRGRRIGWVVRQDKGNVASQVTWPRFSRTRFPTFSRVMSALYGAHYAIPSCALRDVPRWLAGEGIFRTWRRRLSRPLAGLGIAAISAALLSIVGRIFHLRITLNGQCRAGGHLSRCRSSGRARRSWSPPAFRPRSRGRDSRAAISCRAIVRREPSRSRRSSARSPATWWRWSRAGSRSTE